MRVEFLGTGTSQGVPVIACDCKVCQSDDAHDKRLRTSIHLEVEDTSIIIDVGPDFRYQMLRAGIKAVDAVLLTHEHNDHVAGLDDIRPFNFIHRKAMDVYALPRVLEVLENKYDYVFLADPYPGAPRINLNALDSETFPVNGIDIHCLPVLHGRMEVMGFKIGRFAYITDANEIPQVTLNKLKGIDILVLNALRKEPHHSHFNLNQAIEMGDRLQADQLYLTHISHSMGLHSEVRNELPEGVYLAYDGLVIDI